MSKFVLQTFHVTDTFLQGVRQKASIYPEDINLAKVREPFSRAVLPLIARAVLPRPIALNLLPRTKLRLTTIHVPAFATVHIHYVHVLTSSRPIHCWFASVTKR